VHSIMYLYLAVCVFVCLSFEILPTRDRMSYSALIVITLLVVSLYVGGLMLAVHVGVDQSEPDRAWYAKFILLGIPVLAIGLLRYEIRYYRTIMGPKIKLNHGGYDLGRINYLLHQ